MRIRAERAEEEVEAQLFAIAERDDFTLPPGQDQVPVYDTKLDAWRAMTRLLLECRVAPDDTRFWTSRLIERMDRVDWGDVQDELADFIAATPVRRAVRLKMMRKATGIINCLSD